MNNYDLANQLLKKHSIWVTSTRLRILEIFIYMGANMTSQKDLFNMTRSKNIDRTTLYRTLLFFCECGLIYKILDNKGRPFYSLEAGIYPVTENNSAKFSEHYHFNCLKCGSLSRLSESSQTINSPAYHTMVAANLLLLGYCDNCSKKKKVHINI